ncbi:MAG: YceI family protein [Rhodospirillales bacterium]
MPRSSVRKELMRMGVVVILAAAGFGLAGSARAAPQSYVLDTQHTSVAFMVMHMGFAKTLGVFRKAEGSFVFDESEPSVRDIRATIDAASVFTDHEKRDEHLRGNDFLAVQQYPTITFKGVSAVKTGPRSGRVTGDLTLRGVTKPVDLEVVWNKSGTYPFGDGHYATGISARTTIKRSDFGMTYGVEGNLVGDEVDIMLEFEAIRQPAP